MKLADTIGRVCQAHGQDGHAKVTLAVVGIRPPQAQELCPGKPQPGIILAEMAIDQIRVEPVDAGRHRCVCGKHMSRRSRFARFGEGHVVLFHEQANPLKGQEGRVPFVHVTDRRPQVQRLECPDAADAQHDLLANTHFVITAVELIGDIPILWAVIGDVGIKQEQGHTAHLRPPHLRLHHPAWILHLDGQGCATHLSLQDKGQVVEIVLDVEFLLPSVGVEVLAEIALLVEQAHGDEGQTQVTRRFQMIAGQDAQTASIDAQALGQAEFCRKVGNTRLRA